MPYLPLSTTWRQRCILWIDRHLSMASAALGSLPTFQELRPMLDDVYRDLGMTLRWIHPMPVEGGVITSSYKVVEGTIIIGHQGPDRPFAYLDPSH